MKTLLVIINILVTCNAVIVFNDKNKIKNKENNLFHNFLTVQFPLNLFNSSQNNNVWRRQAEKDESLVEGKDTKIPYYMQNKHYLSFAQDQEDVW